MYSYMVKHTTTIPYRSISLYILFSINYLNNGHSDLLHKGNNYQCNTGYGAYNVGKYNDKTASSV